MEENKLTDEISFENRLNVPESSKKKGDEYLKANNLEEAIRCYSKAIMAIKILNDDKAIDGKELSEMVKEIGVPCNLNISYCYLKLKEWQKVIDHTTRVIDFEKKHVKALYRRCLAYIELNKFEKADEDLIILEELIGGSRELEDLENRFENKKKEIQDNEMLIYKKMSKKYFDESIERKNRCKDLIFKTPSIVKNLSYYYFDRFLLTPGKYVISKTTKIKRILIDSTLDYIKSKFFVAKKNN